MPFELFVNGTLMRGLKLHANMGDSEFLGEFRTMPYYRVHTIGDVHPGMYRLEEGETGGASIVGELYMVDEATWAAIEAGEPPNLYRGTIELEDGRKVYGILYPRKLAEGYFPEITSYGGWRAYMDSKSDAEARIIMTMLTVTATPYDFVFDPLTTALIIIDMQRDFVEPGGFGEILGNDVSQLRTAIAPLQKVLVAAREQSMMVIHTREGHRPDLSDLPEAKRTRGQLSCGIGDVGPMGRILVRGEWGHDIIDELKPLPGEPIIDKPGKGSFYATDLSFMLANHGIKRLIVTGVTTEVCVHTTVREANDRGYECLVLSDCVASYFPEFQQVGLKMIAAQGGIFGWVAPSVNLLNLLSSSVHVPVVPTAQ